MIIKVLSSERNSIGRLTRDLLEEAFGLDSIIHFVPYGAQIVLISYDTENFYSVRVLDKDRKVLDEAYGFYTVKVTWDYAKTISEAADLSHIEYIGLSEEDIQNVNQLKLCFKKEQNY
ncbi:hypothetical protein ABE67_14040 [Cytobacillus firmus]|uniref:hypothetical protein n=1 Tax=Cytobacillus firmus TaxID=1399 RepID=UPI0018CD6B2A|nr:hypothetical protein [Cytobacillus firmus]MBG9450416.1 hypothetical protein [Cytobacillus firmus]